MRGDLVADHDSVTACAGAGPVVVELAALEAQPLGSSTFASYHNNFAIHINPRIGHINLQKLQPEDLDTFYAQLLVVGRRNGAGGGLAPKTVRIIHGIIRKALADAQRKGTVIATSPVSPIRRRCASG